MRYFKATITYRPARENDEATKIDQVLYCCSPADFPKDEQLRELFYSIDGHEKTYLSSCWKQIREEDIPTNEIHLI